MKRIQQKHDRGVVLRVHVLTEVSLRYYETCRPNRKSSQFLNQAAGLVFS